MPTSASQLGPSLSSKVPPKDSSRAPGSLEPVLDGSAVELGQVETVALVGAAEDGQERPENGSASQLPSSREPPASVLPESSAVEAPKKDFIMRHLTKLTILGVVIGVLLGVLCSLVDAPPEVVKILAYPGDLFIRALKVWRGVVFPRAARS